MSINNAIVVNQTAHGASVGLLFEATNIQSVGIALGLGIVAIVGIIVRCLFLYYIKYHAPKQRPLNRIIGIDQAILLTGIAPTSAISVGQVALQRPMSQYIGDGGCKLYTVLCYALFNWGVIGGFLMALHRLMCLNGRQMEIKTLMLIGLAILVCETANILVIHDFEAWEKSPVFWYCSTDLASKGSFEGLDTTMAKFLSCCNLSMGLILLISELGIYGYIVMDLWKHDRKYYQEKIITPQTFQMRKEKNVITLRGQIFSFLVESAVAIFFMVLTLTDGLFSDTSYLPFLAVFAPSVVSISQLLTSHEMRRYVKSKFD